MPPYHAKKRMGQHFLRSPEIIARICRLAVQQPDLDVVEIGPGQGELTLPLARSGVRLVAVEFDRDLITPLNNLLRDFPNAQIVNGDFLSFNPIEFGLQRFILVGNLPYNITTPVVEWCINHSDHIVTALLMVQREMALRITAESGSHDWSPLGIFTRLCFDSELCFDVRPSSFEPRPKVMSSVIKLMPKTRTKVANPELFERVVRASFRQRRKQLANNLVPDLIDSTTRAKDMFNALSLPANCRAEQLSIGQFAKIADYIERMQKAAL